MPGHAHKNASDLQIQQEVTVDDRIQQVVWAAL